MKKRETQRPARSLKRSLGMRIALSYTGFLARTALELLLVFSVVYWICAGGNAAIVLRDEAALFPDGEIIVERGQVILAEEALSERAMLSWWDGCPALTLETASSSVYAAYVLRGEWQIYRALVISLIAMELIRMAVLLRRGERISRRALRPISEIVRTARGLTASNLSERIEAHGAQNELKELTQVLNDMLDRIEAAYNSQKQFVSDASHELRTPLAVIQGYADMLDRWGKTDPEVMDESIAAIRTEAAGMKELVEQLLFIARHDNRTHQYDMEYFDACELVEETLRETQMIAERHVVEGGEMHHAIVLGDRGALKQALRVFVDNAIKYTPAGGTIVLSCCSEEGACRITVADNGVGVAEGELARIFERFYRADQSRSGEVDGHGLGLSIARIIVRAHGGRIEVQSKKGSGSRFHIILRR